MTQSRLTKAQAQVADDLPSLPLLSTRLCTGVSRCAACWTDPAGPGEPPASASLHSPHTDDTADLRYKIIIIIICFKVFRELTSNRGRKMLRM